MRGQLGREKESVPGVQSPTISRNGLTRQRPQRSMAVVAVGGARQQRERRARRFTDAVQCDRGKPEVNGT